MVPSKGTSIRRYNALSYCGEEDLLAHYLLNYDQEKNKYVIGTDDQEVNLFMVGEGEWKDFSQGSAYLRKKRADSNSYLWDEIIQRTCQNALDGTLLGDAKILEGKSAIHEMAKEPRFSRRALAQAMIKSIQNFPIQRGIVRNVSFMPSFYKGKAYVFLQLKVDDIKDYENDYRPKRRALLELACASAKNRFDELQRVIGIAIDAPKFCRRNSEDFILMDCTDWPLKLSEHYRKANEGFNFFATDHLVARKMKVTDFPVD